MNTPSTLETLYRTGHLRSLDHALAQSLRRLDPTTPDAVLTAAALASLAVSKGHAGFAPTEAGQLIEADIDWLQADDWQRQLAASPWVATPDDPAEPSDTGAPLVLEHGLLYLRRYREYERRLALGLQRIGAQAPETTDLGALAPLFAKLFPHSLLPPAGEDARRARPVLDTGADNGALSPPTDDRQARAAALALGHTLLLVTGGPGTGKTTTITRLLVLLAAQAQQAGRPAPRIALAAPTGRAAERMAESVRTAVQALTELGIDPDLCAQLPATGTTLHRLLGTIPDSPRFRHHADNPLPFDVVVVDEASMIDLPLMAKLVEAVPDGARLVLLGDPDQLPSVEAGDVLSGILRAAGAGERLARDAAEALQPLLGTPPPPRRHPRGGGDPWTSRAGQADSDFPGRHVHLARGYRQSKALDLAPLANAVRDGDTNTALSLLRHGELSGIHFHENLTDPLQPHRDRLLAHWTALAEADSPADALALASRLRILTAVREGPQGARNLNARIESMLFESRLTGPQHRNAGPGHFHGRLLLITENSYRHRLFNGDIGICLRDIDAGGAIVAWFPGDDPQHPRPFHPAALPAHDSAFAMTVHKAQGSEFDAVWLLLPARFNRVLSRELVYTGLTRARRELHVAAGADVMAQALARHASRWSGLGWRLGATKPPRDMPPTIEDVRGGVQGSLF